MSMTPTKRLLLSALFLAIGLILPFFTGQIPAVGRMLLPMHLPVFLCGLICGRSHGAAVGGILPILRSVLFGMPALYPNAVSMMLELATYGFVAGWLYTESRHQCLMSLYRAMLMSMLAGRLVWGVASWCLLGLQGNGFTLEMFMGGAFLTAFPGILLQLIAIPALMMALHKTHMVPMKGQTVHGKNGSTCA